jgi:hypothetical protein
VDEAPWVLLGLALILYVLSTPFVAWRAFLRGRAFEARLRGSRSASPAWRAGS